MYKVKKMQTYLPNLKINKSYIDIFAITNLTIINRLLYAKTYYVNFIGCTN